MADDTYTGQFYCVKCREKKEATGAIATTEKGARVAKAECPTCGTKLNRFLPRK
jgi:transcription elongation factor Elf1